MTGSIFSIEEFSVYDGPGIRTCVFFMGCPLRCNWCHNPEGLTVSPKRIRAEQGCLHCGRCEAVCQSPEACVFCGACERACPRRLIRIVGKPIKARELADKILKNADMLTSSGGGVTLSGGEVLMQPEFLMELLSYLSPLHRAIETCGHASETVFQEAINACELVLMDLKLMDSKLHKRYTGIGNELILRNFEHLKSSGKPFIIRIPLIPGLSDDRENLKKTAELIAGSTGLLKVELLPYHASAGAKYKMVGMTYDPQFDTARQVQITPEIFLDLGIRCDVL